MEPISLRGKTAVITGATSGVGLATVQTMLTAGARIIAVGRNAARIRQAEEMIRSEHPDAFIKYLLADLSLQSQVRQLAREVRQILADQGIPYLDILLNNAGLYSQTRVNTSEGFELTLATNYLAPFLLTHELIPLIQTAPEGRILITSSSSHYGARLNLNRLGKPLIYIGFWAYMVSKLAGVLFTLELNRRLEGTTVRTFAVDPGLVATDIASKGPKNISSLFWQRHSSKGVAPEVPAQVMLFMAGSPIPRESKDIYWRDFRPKAPSRQALDAEMARGLWRKSLHLCGLDADA